MEEGRKEGRKEARKQGRREGRKQGSMEGSKEARKHERKHGRKGGKKNRGWIQGERKGGDEIRLDEMRSWDLERKVRKEKNRQDKTRLD